MDSFVQTVGNVAIGILLTLVVRYALYKFRERLQVSVEIVAKPMATISEIAIVVANHGQVAVPIAEVSLYVPAEEITLDMPAPKPPSVVSPRFYKLRRLFRTFDSINDGYALMAKAILSNGASKFDVIDAAETLTVLPKQKEARCLPLQNSRLSAPASRPPGTFTLVPSCRAFGQKHTVWGPPMLIHFGQVDGQMVPFTTGAVPTSHRS